MDLKRGKFDSDWNKLDLEDFNIKIRSMGELQFFGRHLSDVSLNCLDEHTLKCIDLSSATNLESYKLAMLPAELKKPNSSPTIDFLTLVLKMCGYEDIERVIRTKYLIDLFMCEEKSKSIADLCLVEPEGALLLVMDGKLYNRKFDPEPQLIASAIAAFQERFKNNSLSHMLRD